MKIDNFANNVDLDAVLMMSHLRYRVRTVLEKSWKMTLGLENSWNSKKVQFVLKLFLNFEKISLIITKMSLKMIETVFWMQCTTKIKKISKSVVVNKVRGLENDLGPGKLLEF